METQDHKKPKQPGHEGHSGGGAHVCSKCSWPFPNSHPSAKQRRAHKKVCGTIEGFRLDNDAQNSTPMMDDSVSEQAFDDEQKAPSVKPVERTVSRRSSGVGSRSSRSTRSEDDVFTDAVTDFTDYPGSGEGSEGGGMQRFYSMQRVTQGDLDELKQIAEQASADADNLSSANDSQDKGQTVQMLDGESDRLEAGNISQDFNSSSASGLAMIPALVTVEHDTKVDTSDESKEIVSSKEKLELGTKDTAEETSEDVSVLKTVDEVTLGPHSAGEKLTGMESTDCKNNLEKSEIVDAPGIIKSLDNPVGVIDPANGNIGRSGDVTEGHGSQSGLNENVYVLAVPDNLPLHQNPEIAVEDLDHKGGKFNGLKFPNSATETGNSKEVSAHALEHVNPGVDLQIGYSTNVRPQDDVLQSSDAMENDLKQNVGQKTLVEERAVGEPAQISDINKASDTDIEPKNGVHNDFKAENLEDEKVSFAEEEKPIVSAGGVFPEGATFTEAADNLDVTNGTFDTHGSVKNNTEHDILQDVNGSELSRKALLGSSSLAEAEHAASGITLQVTELSNIHDINDTGNVEEVGAMQTHLDGNETMGGNEDREAVIAGSAIGSDPSTVGSHDSIHEPLESEKIYDHDKSDKRVDSGDVSLGLSAPTVDSTVRSSAGAECAGENGTGALKVDDIPGSISKIPNDTLKACEDPQPHLQSSVAGNDNGVKKFTEGSGDIEGGRTLNQHVAVSVGDLPDSSSLSDSLEGNWGSVSVLSTISDTPPATPPKEENGSLELKPVTKSQPNEGKTPEEPQVGIETKEGASEIETMEEHQQKGSALQTTWSSSVAHADAPQGGKKDEEIVSKITDWSADKNHTPLKTLLGEATARSRAESPIHNQTKPKTDEIPVAKNGFSKTENVMISSNVTTMEASKEEMGKEWNSPARYPVNIKTEKRKAKGKPYWAPFLCCSSVNAR